MNLEEKLLSQGHNYAARLSRNTGVYLLLILLLAASLRLVKLDKISPPGLNQDEAANAWSAYCILKTGKEYTGVSWPIFYTRNVGGNSSTLYVYLTIPFQAIGGLNVYTTRLPAAVYGIFTVWLIYFVGKRLFGPATALAAAALLAIDPWHLQQSRNGLESCLTPLVCLAPLALLLWAGILSCDKDKPLSPRPFAAAIGGALTGIGCYTHWEVRLFMPVFLFLIFLFTLRTLRQLLKTPKGLLTLSLFAVTFLITYVPLMWQHIFHPEGIARHLYFIPNRFNNVTFATAVKNIALRYIQHFGPNFLFIEGDTNIAFSPPRIGEFYWYMLPLMIAGLIFLIRQFRSSVSARLIIAFLLAYPVGDCLAWAESLSALRSSTGICCIVLLSAIGAVGTFRWLWSKSRNAVLGTAAVFAVIVIGFNVWYLTYFFGDYNRRTDIYHYFHTDLVEACEWLKPRFNNYDVIYCTVYGFNMPYVITTVVLGYDPNLWFSQPRDVVTEGEWDYYTRYGKMYFMYEDTFKPPAEQYSKDRTLFIIRPDELANANLNLKVIHKIIRFDGAEALWLCQPQN